jgi:hypothetical protein
MATSGTFRRVFVHVGSAVGTRQHFGLIVLLANIILVPVLIRKLVIVQIVVGPSGRRHINIR